MTIQRLFQSSPSPKAGSYDYHAEFARIASVSILSQPEGRELPVMANRMSVSARVSILSQPEGRELRA